MKTDAYYLHLLDQNRKKIIELTQENTRLKNEVNNFSNKALLPKEVVEAFDRLKWTWSKFLKKSDMNLLFLTIPKIAAAGDALTLKKFALENPGDYFRAVANGYVVDKNKDENEVAGIINEWLNTSIENDPDEDVKILAEQINNYYLQKT